MKYFMDKQFSIYLEFIGTQSFCFETHLGSYYFRGLSQHTKSQPPSLPESGLNVPVGSGGV